MNHDEYYNLEERCFEFAKRVRAFLKTVPRTIANIEDGKQLVRCSGSVGANYIEANEAVSDKDCTYRMKVSRKEAKESRFFLRLIDTGGSSEAENERKALCQEATELTKIFGSMIRKREQ